MMKQLENVLNPTDYNYTKESKTRSAVIVDFMSVIRKVPFQKCSKMKDVLETTWNIILAASDANRIEVVYDSYLEGSVKESLRIRRAKVQPIEIINLSMESSMPIDMETFWASPSNKEHLQVISRDFFLKKAVQGYNIILSGYVTDGDGVFSAIEVKNGNVSDRPDLNCTLEEADCRLILHIAKAGKEHYDRIIVLSNDTDVFIYNLAYYEQFRKDKIRELWIRFGVKEKARNIPIHRIAEELGVEKSAALLKAYILTGCDVTSKVGTKAAAFKAKPEVYLKYFGVEPVTDYVFQQAEKYLVNVIDPNTTCEKFDDLRHMMYTSTDKTLLKLPPTSSAIKGHLLRCHYVVNLCINLLDSGKEELRPVNFGWKRVHGMLVPDQNLQSMPTEFTTKCGCKKGCTKGCGCKRNSHLCTEYCKCLNCSNN